MSTISGFISTGREVKFKSKFLFAFLPENDLPRFVNFLVLLLWLHFRMQLRVSEFCSTVAAYTASSTSSPVSVKVFIFLSLCRYSKMISLTNHFKKNFLNWSQLPVAMPQLEEWMEHLSFMFYFWLPFEICPTWLILHEIKFYFISNGVASKYVQLWAATIEGKFLRDFLIEETTVKCKNDTTITFDM